MKCPFRTTKTTKTTVEENPFHPNYGKPKKIEETTEFEPCLGIDCPYFGKRVFQQGQTGGFRQIAQPKCRRAGD